MTSFVVSLMGADRPGLVEQVSQRVVDAGGNWEESRMAQLAGHFAGILLVRVPDDRADALEEELSHLETDGLHIMVARGHEPSLTPHRELTLSVVGDDRPGIVLQIARILAANDVNVESLQSETESAPMSGHMMFRASFTVRAPASVHDVVLRRAIERIADELMVEITFL